MITQIYCDTSTNKKCISLTYGSVPTVGPYIPVHTGTCTFLYEKYLDLKDAKNEKTAPEEKLQILHVQNKKQSDL